MSTRSRIALQLNEDAFLSVYHHWDGYPQWLGVTLKKKFNTREKVAEAIDGGDISCIASENTWDLNEKVDEHILYYNDRGEKSEPRLDLNFDDFCSNATACEEYLYVFTLDHEWECYAIDQKYNEDYSELIATNIVPTEIPEEYPVQV
tara:strand:+ start:100 stop:543 length:444 start_codon:yes stop_codon:yes gene_type:complete